MQLQIKKVHIRFSAINIISILENIDKDKRKGNIQKQHSNEATKQNDTEPNVNLCKNEANAKNMTYRIRLSIRTICTKCDNP